MKTNTEAPLGKAFLNKPICQAMKIIFLCASKNLFISLKMNKVEEIAFL